MRSSLLFFHFLTQGNKIRTKVRRTIGKEVDGMKRKLLFIPVVLVALAGFLPGASPAAAAEPPVVTTESATNITGSSARLNGTLASLGTATTANVSFQWGLSSGNYTYETTPVSMQATGSFSANLTGLTLFTNYYYRTKAIGDGISYGNEKTFGVAVASIPTIIYVPDNYATIQEAVNAAGPGMTIMVRDGTYTENVDVTKAVTIQSVNGANVTIVRTANPGDHVFNVMANHVTISGFTVQDATGQDKAGIYVGNGWIHSTISKNVITNNHRGIVLYYSSNNTIVVNNVSSTNVTVGSSTYGGLGLVLDHSNGNTIRGNTVRLNPGVGLYMYFATGNNITASDITSNGKGIVIDHGSSNLIYSNNVTSNLGYGIMMEGAGNYGNILYLNNFVNTSNYLIASDSSNNWNSLVKLSYRYSANNGTFTSYVGNYWSNHVGTDTNNDGIGEASYNLSGTTDNDNWPLMANARSYQIVPPRKAWLFLVYMGADNNLDPAGVDDLNEMEMAGSSDSVNIVALFDRFGPGNTNIYYVLSDNDTASIKSKVVSGPFGNEVDTGDPNTLVTFVTWAMDNYPADHYALVLWNHGSGWRSQAGLERPLVNGIVYDDTSGGNHISTEELGIALSQIPKLDIIGFDACFMQMLEIAYQIKDAAGIMVGAEGLVPGDGWPYDAILRELRANPASTPVALAKIITDNYASYYSGQYGVGFENISALRLVDMSLLSTALSDLANTLTASEQWQKVVTARTLSETFEDDDFVDLYDFARNIKSISASAVVQAKAQALMDSVNASVVAGWHSTGHPDAHGLSIHFPLSGFLEPAYGNLALSLYQGWDEFLAWYLLPQELPWIETVTDPVGDQVTPGAGPDIASVESSLTANLTIGFRVQTTGTIDFNSFWGTTFLDTDHNPATGAPGPNAIGDYAIWVSTQSPPPGKVGETLSGISGKTAPQNGAPLAALLRWDSTLNSFQQVSMLPVYADNTSYWTMVPLALLGNDDGDMGLLQWVGVIGSPDVQWPPTDIAPDPPGGSIPVRVSINAPVKVAPNRDFTAKIDISQVQNLDAANYDVSFNPAVLRLDNVTGGNTGGVPVPVSAWIQMSPGLVRIVHNIPRLSGTNGTGDLAVLHFYVLGTIGQSSNITLSNGTLSSNNATEIPATWLSGLVVVSVLPGDASGDGVINAIDITRVERIVAHLDTITDGADANGDGAVNALDVTAVERIIARLDGFPLY